MEPRNRTTRFESDVPIEAHTQFSVPQYDEAQRSRRIFFLKLLWRERRSVARAQVLGILAATFIAFLIPVRYEATMRLLPPDALWSLSPSEDIPSTAIIRQTPFPTRDSSALFIDILKSSTITSGIVTRFGLQKVYRTRSGEEAQRRLAQDTTISENKDSGVVTISVEDRDPQRAHDLLQAYLEGLKQSLTQLFSASSVPAPGLHFLPKVIDPPNFPRSKSFPPRTLIVFCGWFLSLSGGVLFVLGKEGWQQFQEVEPRFAQEIVGAPPWGELAALREVLTAVFGWAVFLGLGMGSLLLHRGFITPYFIPSSVFTYLGFY
jgi:uncharacterized protein involved in exopolysaccharide biosynthesis